MTTAIRSEATRSVVVLNGVDKLAINEDGSMELLTPAANPTGNDVPTAGQLPFVKEYNSPAQAMANSALFTLPHGLGYEPKNIQLVAQCKTADGGYSVGNRIRLSPGTGISSITGATPAVWADATNIYVRCYANNFAYVHASNSTGTTLAHTSWNLYVRAW